MFSIQQHHHLPECVATLSIAATAVAILLYTRHTIEKKNEKVQQPQLPPYAPTTMLKTISAFTSGQTPWFFLRLQKELLPVKVFRLPLPKSMAPHWIVVGDAKIATQILQDATTERPKIGYVDIDNCIGSGPSVVTMEGEGWKHRRLATNMAFSSHDVRRMGEVAVKCTQDWMNSTLVPLSQVCSDSNGNCDRSFDVGKEMVRLTITIILEAALEYKATKEEADHLANEFLIATHEFQKISAGMNPFRQLFGKFNKGAQRAKLAKENLFSFAKKIIHCYQENADRDEKNTNTLLKCIMLNPNYQSDDERASDVVMFMYAGFDNTGYAIAWTLLELGWNPTVVASLKSELKDTPKDEWHKSTPLRNIMKESMRLHPVTPGGSVRLAGKSFVFEDIIIPKGSMVQVPSMLYTRDEDVFDDPDEFQPDRWNNKNKSQSMTETFLPFVAGRHNCAGQALANIEIEMVLSLLVQEYDFRVASKGEEQFSITLKPVGARLTPIRKLAEKRYHTRLKFSL